MVTPPEKKGILSILIPQEELPVLTFNSIVPSDLNQF